MGGFLMAIMIGLGVYAWKEAMNITLICYWGMLCLINGCFDLVKAIEGTVKSLPDASASSQPLPLDYKVQLAVCWAIPLSTLAGLPLAWWVYRDFVDHDVAPESVNGRLIAAEQSGERARLLGSSSSAGRGTFTAFEGQGQRLGQA